MLTATKMSDFDLTILQEFISGKATPEQERLVYEWLESSEENRRFFVGFTTNATLHETLISPDFLSHREDMISRLNSRIDAGEEQTQRRSFSFTSAFAGFAAAVAAAIVTAVFLFHPLRLHPGNPVKAAKVAQEAEAPMMYSYANSSATVRSVLLADGSKIFLKPGSELEYNVTGLSDKRELYLTGEMYIDVAKDSLRPMFVRTGKLSLKVLGTAFSLKTSPSDSRVEVVLERGSVRLLSPDGVGLVRLSPNQKAVYDSVTEDVNIESLRAMPYLIEQFNLESLSDVTVNQIISHLEHIYGVRIIATISHPDRRYYFNFLKTDTIEEVLNIVENLSGERCRIAPQSQPPYM